MKRYLVTLSDGSTVEVWANDELEAAQVAKWQTGKNVSRVEEME